MQIKPRREKGERVQKSGEKREDGDSTLTTNEAIRRLKRGHLIAALRRIDRDGVPKRRQSTRYCLIEGNKHYPPKLVLKFASEQAGVPLGRTFGRQFFGGEQANRPLRDFGFTVRACRYARRHEYTGTLTTNLPPPMRTNRPAPGKSKNNNEIRHLPSSGSAVPPADDGYLRATAASLKHILRRHATLGQHFSEWLKSRGCRDVVFERSRVDIEFSEDGQLCRAELKVCGAVGAIKALREALGQLLEYNYYGGRKRADRWYIVLDTQPSAEDRDYIRTLQSELRLPPLVLCWPEGKGFAQH